MLPNVVVVVKIKPNDNNRSDSEEMKTKSVHPIPSRFLPQPSAELQHCLDGTMERKDTHIKTQFFLPS